MTAANQSLVVNPNSHRVVSPQCNRRPEAPWGSLTRCSQAPRLGLSLDPSPASDVAVQLCFPVSVGGADQLRHIKACTQDHEDLTLLLKKLHGLGFSAGRVGIN